VPDPSQLTQADLEGPDAADALARLRGVAPVAQVPAVGGWLVTGHREAREILRDDVTFTVDDPRFSTARVVGPSMLSLDGAPHRVHRGAFATPFRPRRVAERFTEQVTAFVRGVLASVRGRGETDLRLTLAGPLSVAVVTSALGLPETSAATVLAWYRDIVGAVTAISAGRPGSAEDAMQQLAERVRAAIETRPESALRGAATTLDEPAIVSNAAVMMFGGIETTEGMICNALVQVLSSADVADALRQDPELTPVAVEESLRLEPAAAALDRYTTAPARLGGVSIPRGELVRISVLAANRDPAVFHDPDAFRLGRPGLRNSLAFAEGPHICIAADLARLETSIAVGEVLASLPGVRLVDRPRPSGLIFRKPAAVRVVWDVP
jgi:cytochrome P450